MPPKNLRRPAARLVRPKAKVAVGPGRRLRRPAHAEESDPPIGPPVPGWIKAGEWKPSQIPLGKALVAKVWYCGEEGLLHGELRDETKDMEGQWLGLKLLGTTIDQLRNWALTHGSGSNLFLATGEVAPPERRHMPGVGYLLEVKERTDADQEPWQKNCIAEGGPEHETRDLLKAAQGLAAGALGGASPSHQRDGKTEEVDPPTKKLSGKQKVKRMVEKAKWSPKGTPLDPAYKKPIRLKVQKKKSSSSSSSPTSGSSHTSEGGLGSEHRLRGISRRLPGYLARQSAKEAIKMLATQTGEGLSTYQVFNRYYRQVVQGRGGSRGLQRELFTLSSVVDLIISGEVLTALDTLCQRIKGLELLQQGAESSLAMQVELLPREQLGLTQDVEGRFAHKEFVAESKLLRQLKSSSPGAKGTWGGNPKGVPSQPFGKGKKGKPWGKASNKGDTGKKGGDSPIVPVAPPG